MSRKPTPAEIAETNQHIIRTCDSCNYQVEMNKDYRTFENCLTLTLTGGYGEFIDTWANEGEELFLCHECGHLLMDVFKNLNIKGWHPKTDDPYCNGWTIEDYHTL